METKCLSRRSTDSGLVMRDKTHLGSPRDEPWLAIMGTPGIAATMRKAVATGCYLAQKSEIAELQLNASESVVMLSADTYRSTPLL